MLPRALVDEAARPKVDRARRDRVALDFREGVTVQSPVEGVRARKWLRVAIPALESKGLSSVRQALSPDGFHAVEQEVIPPESDVRCHVPRLRREHLRSRLGNAPCDERRVPLAPSSYRGSRRVGNGLARPLQRGGCATQVGELTGKVCWQRRLVTVEPPRVS